MNWLNCSKTKARLIIFGAAAAMVYFGIGRGASVTLDPMGVTRNFAATEIF